jgi:L-ascorbate metabolism protein UlaG (beta-lactamase superfamily)
MRITWLGHASFMIESEGRKLVTDPYDKIGLQFPSVSANVVTTSHSHFDHSATSLVHGRPRIISGTGRFDEDPFRIKGLPTYHDEAKGSKRGQNTAYLIEAEGIRVCHLGDLGHVLTAGDAASFSRVDILMVPVGGVFTIDAAGAQEVCETLDPRIVLPMHYKVPGLSIEVGGAEEFTRRYSNVRKAEVLEVSCDELPEEIEIFVLQRKI